MPKYTRWMPTIVMSIVAMLPLTVARGETYTASSYSTSSSGSVSDHMVDPLIGPTTHDYAKTTGDVIWSFDYINLVNPVENITAHGWVRFSLAGLPPDAVIQSASARLVRYGFVGAAGAPMVVTAVTVNPETATPESLHNAAATGTVLSASDGNGIGPLVVPLNGDGLAHLQSAMSQGWVALGYKYNGAQTTLDYGVKCRGANYFNPFDRPTIEITYALPDPTGACCAADGTCTVETEADCLAAGGTYQGDGTGCDPNPCPQPSTHALTLTPDATCYTTSGGTVTVDVVFTQTGSDEVLGGQFFLDYDETKLDFVSVDTGDVPFTNELYEAVNETTGTIDYAVGLPLAGDPGYSGAGPLTMATITFETIGEACDVADLVTFRDTGQAYETRLTRRVGVDGSEPFVPEGLNDLEAITLDWTAPTITCPTDINQTADAGVCYATIADLGTPTTGDNCGVASVTNDKPVDDQYAVGVTTVTWTVTDTCGNTATCEQTVTVTDDEDPTITCPADINQTADAGVCYATIADLGTPTTGDNCGVDTVTNDKPVDDQYPVGTTIVTWTVTDIHGNTATCEQTVTVTDDEDPTIACPADVQVTADAGVCYATGVALGTPTTDDNCAVDTVTNDAPAQFPVGDTTVTWTVTDIHGNSATCEQTVTVTDDEDPTIACPADVQVTADAGVCYATGVALGTPTTDDNCAVDAVTNDAPAQFPVGDTTVTWTVTDIHGNSATCEQTVTVTDDEDPVITGCPDDITVNADAGTCDAVVTWTPPTADDNCGIQSFTSSHNPGDTFGPGTTTVTYTATDIHGNTSTCTFDVTVLGFSDFVVDVQLQGIDTAVTRCITFTFVNCTTMDAATLEKDMAFDATGIGSATFTDLPCGAYDCVTAEDELHTLLVRLDSAPDFEIVGTAYVADFTGANLLTTADYYNDNLIDIADFGTFIAQWGACYDSDSDTFCDGDTPCGVFAQNSHADANGDGVLDVTDFNPISGNFLSLGDDDCCSRGRGGDGAPRTAVTVRELRQAGVRNAWRADLNRDGWIDLDDVQLFMNGEVPDDLPQPVPAHELRPSQVQQVRP